MEKNNDFIKKLLNNLPLLKFVRKNSCDNLMDDNSLATKFKVKTLEDSISLGNSTLTQLFVTSARYNGTEHCRFSIEQLSNALEVLGKVKGELIISNENSKEMFLQVGDSVMVISPLPQTDKPSEEK